MTLHRTTSAALRRVASEAHAHFVPSERNGHVPHVLKHRVLVGYSLVLILVKALALAGYVLLPASSVYSSAVTSDNVVHLANAARTSLELPELSVDARLARAAAAKAEDMVINGYFAHKSPAGVTPWSWIRAQGYDYRYAGENLAVHLFSAEGVHEGWMASPTHRDNIVSPKYTQIGVGIARGTYEGYETVFVVEMFGTPKSAPAPAVAPAAPEPEPAALAVAVAPAQGGYKVTLKEEQAPSAATAMIAGNAVPMAPNASGELEAVVPVDAAAIPPAGAHVYVAVESASAPREVASVAIVAPTAGPQQLFAPVREAPPFKLFGLIEIRNLEDSVRRFYVVMSVLLGAVLLAGTLIRFELRKHTIALHAMLVIGLSVTLAFL